MVKDEEVAPYLSEAFSRYASGQKMRDIAKWLNEQNVEPPMKHKKRIQGKPYEGEPDLWTSDNLRGLFRNPTYTGDEPLILAILLQQAKRVDNFMHIMLFFSP